MSNSELGQVSVPKQVRRANLGLFLLWPGTSFNDSCAFQAPGPGLHILPDTGAVKNVCGEAWANQAVHECERLGLPYKVQKLRQPRGHNGVGNGAVSCEWTISVPCSVGKRTFTYTADVIPSPNVPALLGLRDMSDLDVHISVKSGAFILPGPGGLKPAASPGTEIVAMRRTNEDHHWFLPVNQHLSSKWLAAPLEKRLQVFQALGGRQIGYANPF